MTLSYHLAEARDYHSLHGILQVCGEHMYRVQGLEAWYPYRGFDKYEAETQGAFVYKVLDDDLLVGTFYLQPTPRPYYTLNRWQNPEHTALYLGGVGVLPLMQGHGVGRWLMDAVDAITQEKGYDAVRFDGVSSNTGLLAFYDKLGYTRCGEIHFGTKSIMCYEKVFTHTL